VPRLLFGDRRIDPRSFGQRESKNPIALLS
jgi:hypothetical protein